MIIFRDLSAANVLLTSTVPTEADIKLIDFGLHKLLPRQRAAGASAACMLSCFSLQSMNACTLGKLLRTLAS